MRTLLVTGASGFVGWHLCAAASGQWRVVGTVLRHEVAPEGVDIERVDLTDPDAVGSMLDRVKPAAVIHAAAMTDVNACERDPDSSRRINTDAAVALARACKERAAKFVFTSTDMVFDGEKAPYREEDPPEPVNVYGRQKLEAERGIKAAYSAAVVCRLALVFGPASPVSGCFVQGWAGAIGRGERLKLFTDEVRTPISVRDAAAGILLALERGQGLVHLGGPERISRYKFGLLMCEHLGLDASRIRPCWQRDVPMAAPRPRDLSLNITRARVLGFKPGRIGDGLAAMRERV